MLRSLFSSFIVGQVLGLYMLIMAIVMLSRANYYKDLIQRITLDDLSLWIGSSFSLLLGIFLVVIHNVWVLEPRVLVTIIAWLILIKAILWLALPEKMLEYSQKVYDGAGYYIIAVLMAIVGILILTRGFYLFL